LSWCDKTGWWCRTSRLEACDVLADGLDCAGAVGSWDDVVLHGEGVHALGDDEIAVVERRGVDWIIVSIASEPLG
jgi:hypothetical protein